MRGDRDYRRETALSARRRRRSRARNAHSCDAKIEFGAVDPRALSSGRGKLRGGGPKDPAPKDTISATSPTRVAAVRRLAHCGCDSFLSKPSTKDQKTPRFRLYMFSEVWRRFHYCKAPNKCTIQFTRIAMRTCSAEYKKKKLFGAKVVHNTKISGARTFLKVLKGPKPRMRDSRNTRWQ